MGNKCLYCYNILEDGGDYHPKCSQEFFGTPNPPKIPYTLGEMAALAKNVVERSISVPGVQPKISMGFLNEATNRANERLSVVGALGGQYILKPPSDQFPEMPENEHITMKMAQALGIKTVPCALMRMASGELAYITKRVDRTENLEMIHMIDMFQITEAFDKYRSSHERIGDAIDLYSDNTLLDKIRYFEVVLYSFLIGNSDMHLKNFSMIQGNNGWELSPAYDMLNVNIIFPEDKEETALTIFGKKNKIKLDHFSQLGNRLKLTDKQISNTYIKFWHWSKGLGKRIDESFLSEEMKNAYKKLFSERVNRILSAKDVLKFF